MQRVPSARLERDRDAAISGPLGTVEGEHLLLRDGEESAINDCASAHSDDISFARSVVALLVPSEIMAAQERATEGPDPGHAGFQPWEPKVRPVSEVEHVRLRAFTPRQW